MKRLGAIGRDMALALTCAVRFVHAQAPAPGAAELQAAIVSLDRLQPNSPAALGARVDYADFLLQNAPGTCRERADLTQSHLDGVTGNPVTQVVFPGGWSRAADLQYRIDRVRADCDTEPGLRNQALASAAAAAAHAADLYRAALDYHSLAVMQYNVAVTYQALGDETHALAALEAALALDREFGLRADAQDNYATLLRWRKAPAGPDDVARLMADFPTRSVTLKFGWRTSEGSLSLDVAHAAAINGKLIHASDSLEYARSIRAGANGWLVTTTPRGTDIDPGPWPQDPAGAEGPVETFRPTLLQFPAMEILSNGEFIGADDLAPFATRVTHDALTAISTRAPAGAHTRQLIKEAAHSAQMEFAPEVIANEVSETYGLETAMWIGATLKQGVAYELTAPLSLPGAAHVIVVHRLQFTFTREVPCPGSPVSHPCVELVVSANPMPEALQNVMAGFQLPQGAALHYASSLVMRLIVDPETLIPYLRDTQRYWYVALGRQLPTDVLLESDHSQFRYDYR